MSDTTSTPSRANLDGFHSIEEIVEELDDENSYHAYRIAGTYALEAAEESGFGIASENIEAHLLFLSGDGAVFDFAEALSFAELIVKEEQA